MSDIAVKVENLGKTYLVGHESAEKERYTALRDVLARNAKSFARKTKDMLSGKPIVQGDEVEEFWALKDINFEIRQGESVGIIGRNGAGKSTLLKVLSRITEPTTGRVSLNGRVASLLEVGTGFHPELTGRENIFLNGAILGMSRSEIQKKFDEIVEFAEVERFLDTPVKRYSSGMYVRLAFAVAAHLEPEILVVDEVLAVGDASFQKKCLGKMGDVTSKGRTVILVSHQLDTIGSLCKTCLFLHQGILRSVGATRNVIQEYQQTSADSISTMAVFAEDRKEEVPLQVQCVQITDEYGVQKGNFDVFEKMAIRVTALVNRPSIGAIITITVKRDGVPVLMSFSSDYDSDLGVFSQKGRYTGLIMLPSPLLKQGHYSLDVNTGMANGEIYQQQDSAIRWAVSLMTRDGSLASFAEKRPGLIATNLNWNIERVC